MRNLAYILLLAGLGACGINPGIVPTLSEVSASMSTVTGVLHDAADEPPLVHNEEGMLIRAPIPGVTYETQEPVTLTFGGTANL